MTVCSHGHVTDGFSVKQMKVWIPNVTLGVASCTLTNPCKACTHNTKCSSHTGFRVSGLTSVTWIHLAGNTSLVLERFSSFSFLFLKLNFRSFFSSVSRGLWPTRIPSMQYGSLYPDKPQCNATKRVRSGIFFFFFFFVTTALTVHWAGDYFC